MPKPVVAAVQGAAAGFGLSLVLAADLAIAAEDAVFTCGYIHLGTSPDGGMTALLPGIVGLKLASELTLLGDRFDAHRALALGLVNRLVRARSACCRSRSPGRTARRRPERSLCPDQGAAPGNDRRRLRAQLRREAENFAACAATEDFVEGVRAFLEKRRPSFIGQQ